MNQKKFMRHALRLAQKGAGFVNPNPMVGAVIVKNDKIIGAGYHEKFGAAHAEIMALKNIDKRLMKDAMLYVTLEPCCHFGKTPPCTDAILQSGIKKVVVGMEDPNPLVRGKGIKILKKNNIIIEMENLNGEIDVFYEYFKKYINTGVPYITIKMAMTLDGKIASVTGDSKWISCEKSRKLVHEYRKLNDAVLVGVDTIIKDNPKLTPYLIDCNAPPPLRIILDPNLRIPINSIVLNDGNPTLIVTKVNGTQTKNKTFNFPGVKILPLQIDKNKKFDLSNLLFLLGKQGITSIFIEGGSVTSSVFLEQKLADKIMIFIAPKILGGKYAPSPVAGNGIEKIQDAIEIKNLNIKKIDTDILMTGYPEYV